MSSNGCGRRDLPDAAGWASELTSPKKTPNHSQQQQDRSSTITDSPSPVPLAPAAAGNLPKDCRLSVIEKRSKILEAAKRLNDAGGGGGARRMQLRSSPYPQTAAPNHIARPLKRNKTMCVGMPPSDSLPSTSTSSNSVVLIEYLPPFNATNGQRYKIVSKAMLYEASEEKTVGEIVSWASSGGGGSLKQGVYLGEFNSKLVASRELARLIHTNKLSSSARHVNGHGNSLSPQPPQPPPPPPPFDLNQMDRLFGELAEIKSMLEITLRNHEELMNLLAPSPLESNDGEAPHLVSAADPLMEMPRLPPAGEHTPTTMDSDNGCIRPFIIATTTTSTSTSMAAVEDMPIINGGGTMKEEDVEEPPPNIKQEPMGGEVDMVVEEEVDDAPPQIDVYAEIC